jgi:hypothetical protein
MKKILLTIVIAAVFTGTAAACDICGCGVGSSYIGILPEFNKTIFGLRYRYNSLLTHVGTGGTTTYLTTKETYNTAEAWGGWNITSRIRIMASMPYNFNAQLNQGTTATKNGLGDVTVSGFYNLVNHRATVLHHKLLAQSLWVGGGVKLPSGRYNPLDKSTGAKNTNLFQLGTGSVDFLTNVMYDVRLQDAGLNLAASYKINTTNKHGYGYGNKLTTNAQLYYKIKIKKVTIAPNAGALYETGDKDIDNQFSVYTSGGNLLLGTAGAEATFKNIAIGANWQTPLTQNLGGGIIKANNRMMLHLSILL